MISSMTRLECMLSFFKLTVNRMTRSTSNFTVDYQLKLTHFFISRRAL